MRGGGGSKCQPCPKRRKVDDANNYVEEITAKIDIITPNMGEKRKNPIIENDDNVDGNLAKKRKKSFQQDIRLFTMRNPIDEADRVNEIMTNNLTKTIDYRPSVPRVPEIADHADNSSEYSGGVGTCEQSKNSGQGVATDSLNTILPCPTQSVAKGDIVTGIASIELNSGLGTAEQSKNSE